jgi:hypothetical protein
VAKKKAKGPDRRALGVVISGDDAGSLAVAGELAALMELAGAEVSLYIGAASVPQNSEAGEVLRGRRISIRLQRELNLGR